MKKANEFLLNPKWVLIGDAVLFGVAGILLVAAPYLIGVDLPERPYGLAAVLRVLGAALLSVSGAALVLAYQPDRTTLEQGVAMFTVAHGLLISVILMQRFSIWEDYPPGDALYGILIAFLMLHSFRSHRSFFATLIGRRTAAAGPSIDQLRSEWEIGIREAAGQEERHRLARDLHDSVKQQIFAIQTSVAAAQVRFDEDPASAKTALHDARQLTRDAMSEMNTMLDQLQADPLENQGLEAAIRQQCEALGIRTGANVSFRATVLPDERSLPPGAHRNLFRVAQEALSNIARHARAKSVEVSLGTADNDLCLTIRDDGAGFDPAAPGNGMGLRNIRSRAEEVGGILAVQSGAGSGSNLEVRIPIAAPVNLDRRALAGWALLALFGLAKFWPDDWSGFGILVAGLCGMIATVWRSRRKAAAL